MSKQVAMRVTGGILLAAFLALVILVATSPHRFLYDEPDYADYVPLLHRYGLTTEFMNSLNGAAGPLHAFVQIVFEPLTHLQPVRMRLVNVLLLVVIAATLTALLKQQKWPDYWLAGGSVLVVPMTWVLAGMALTEMSAMLFVTVSLCLQLRGLGALERGEPVLGWFLASGIFLGVAVWGRQPYLLLSGVPVLLAILDKKLRTPALVFIGVVLAFAIPLFIIWKGLLPPSQNGFHEQGFSPAHGVVSLGYTGICFLLLAPRAKWLPKKVLIGIVVLTAAANAWTGAFALYPIRSVVSRYIPASAVPVFGNLCGSLFLSCGVVLLAVLLRIVWEGREDLKRVAVNAGLLCVAASPAFVAHQYSSRYTAMSLPYLILAAQPWREWKLKTVVTAVLGCGAGYMSLSGYFSQ